ncbi:PHD finger protein ALFIN-LIKE 6-like, partial [Aphis craccivora]
LIIMTVGEVSSHEETIVLYEINNSHNIELQKTAWGTTEHITLAINNENDTRVTMSLGLSSDEEDDYFCIVCLGAYSKSRKGEDWIQCNSCKKWAHEKCAGKQNVLFFNCKHSSSDIEDDED